MVSVLNPSKNREIKERNRTTTTTAICCTAAVEQQQPGISSDESATEKSLQQTEFHTDNGKPFIGTSGILNGKAAKISESAKHTTGTKKFYASVFL